MKILSFDTSNNLASVAVMRDGEILSYHITKQSSQQAEKLFDLIALSLKEAKISLYELDLISVTNGPGSFTGVRIALAAILGMKTGLKSASIIAITNFQVLAWLAQQEYPNQNIAVAIDARRGQYYFQSFDHNLIALCEPKLLDASVIPDEDYVFDRGSSENKTRLIKDQIIHADSLARSTEFYWQNKLYHDISPLYIRQPDAVETKDR